MSKHLLNISENSPLKESFVISSQLNAGKSAIKFKFSSSVESSVSKASKVNPWETAPPKKFFSASQGEALFIVVFLLGCEIFHLCLVRINNAQVP